MTPIKQIFAYAHECGHHVNGRSEEAADCFAVRTGRDQSWLSRQDALEICEADWNYSPQIRCEHFMSCYNN